MKSLFIVVASYSTKKKIVTSNKVDNRSILPRKQEVHECRRSGKNIILKILSPVTT